MVFGEGQFIAGAFKFTPGWPMLPWQRNVCQNKLWLSSYRKYRWDASAC